MEIYIFNEKIELLGILEEWLSIRWVRRYNKCGEFEIHLNYSEEIYAILKEDNIIWKTDGDEAGYIDYINIVLTKEGNETIVVKGDFLEGYLERRIIWDTLSLHGTAEEIVRQIVINNAINPLDQARKINLLRLGNKLGVGDKIHYQVSYKNALEEIEELTGANDLGFRTVFSATDKAIIFDLYKGKDRTVNQTVHPPAIFSQEFDNVLEQEYVKGVDDYKNTVLVAGEGEGKERYLTSLGSAKGLDRYELFVDARDLQSSKRVNDEDVPIPLAEYEKLLLTRARNKRAEYQKTESFDSRLDLESNIAYKEDFDLGDRVTNISTRWGLLVEERITEIEEIYEADGFSVYITIGEESKDIVYKIKREVS